MKWFLRGTLSDIIFKFLYSSSLFLSCIRIYITVAQRSVNVYCARQFKSMHLHKLNSQVSFIALLFLS